MLSIGKLGAGVDQLEYYEQQVAAGLEDYYSGRGEAPGRWLGRGAAALGLSGEVEAEDFMVLMRDGRDPVSGHALRRSGGRVRVAGFDLTFSAPKSVSVLFAVADEEIATALVAAHDQAVAAALSYLEREACVTRRGHAGAVRLRGEGFVAAAYRHRLSRAGDPQLHTHLVVANLTRAEGRWTALEGHALYEHKMAAGAVYRAVLRAAVRSRLSWVRWRVVGEGLHEIDDVPDGVLREFSQRRREILEAAGAGATVGAAELARLALVTRRTKEYGVSGAGWRERARARAAEHGLGEAELAALQRRDGGRAGRLDERTLAARLSGPEGLTLRRNTFARRDVLEQVAAAFVQGASVEELELTATRYLADPSVRAVEPRRRQERYTTVGLLACERALVQGALARAGERSGIIDPRLIEATLRSFSPGPSGEQAEAVRALAASGRGVEVVIASAGTGKTTLAGALAACYRQAGVRVIGVAPTARAARELRDRAGVDAAFTLHRLVTELDRGGFGPCPTVLVFDEAGIAPTRLSAVLLARAGRERVKVVAIGDPGQLPALEAGGWLAALAHRVPGPSLVEVVRQRDPVERCALAALRGGHPDHYLEHKQAAGLLAVHEHATDAHGVLLSEWDAARRRYGLSHAVMIARDNHTRSELNHAARAHLTREGLLTGSALAVDEREFMVGDRVIARRNDRYRDIDNGTRATIIALDSRTLELTVETDAGARRRLGPAYAAEHLEHAYALTGHGAQGATVQWAGVIGRSGDFTREWAYTALSRARNPTYLHIIRAPHAKARERDAYAPPPPSPEPDATLAALRAAMRRRELEPLALEQLPGPELPAPRANAPRPVRDAPARVLAPSADTAPRASVSTAALHVQAARLRATIAQADQVTRKLEVLVQDREMAEQDLDDAALRWQQAQHARRGLLHRPSSDATRLAEQLLEAQQRADELTTREHELNVRAAQARAHQQEAQRALQDVEAHLRGRRRHELAAIAHDQPHRPDPAPEPQHTPQRSPQRDSPEHERD
jgi:conjugative relaxase-like TrwC/TraI family protein